jgi:hypothetical protein
MANVSQALLSDQWKMNLSSGHGIAADLRELSSEVMWVGAKGLHA